ncbi:hypothetical protein Psfp_03118 [Pelotomaculum sp. FP]|nr:hypothetical protein Psfp_03118 [Pelotomaculum sp. FP]
MFGMIRMAQQETMNILKFKEKFPSEEACRKHMRMTNKFLSSSLASHKIYTVIISILSEYSEYRVMQ